jgi:DNA-binding winged helix-turn-helix (wHTH) protein/tetratricopeptide (TPR) repeat protein
MHRFAGFVLDEQHAELRGPDGEAIRLRPKTLDLLRLFAANPGRVLSKPELMAAVWPNVHVNDDSLFQCVREIRTALGDDKRQLVRVVSGRGYRFEAKVSQDPFDADAAVELSAAAVKVEASAATEPGVEPATSRPRFGLRRRAALAIVVALGTMFGLVVAAPIFAPDRIFARRSPTIAVMAILAAGDDPSAVQMAVEVTARLADGLARIDTIRVVTPSTGLAPAAPATASTTAAPADFIVSGELQKGERSWNLQARLTATATHEVEWTTSLAVDSAEDPDMRLQQSRLAAGIGHPLALRLNALINSDARSAATDTAPAVEAKVVIEQATAYINQTTPERFRAAQTMLEKALAADPDNVDLEVALAAQLLRGVQMVWYGADESGAAESKAQSMLERALRAKPNYIPVREAYCRLLVATNHFSEGLVACARTLSFDPWNGIALFHTGMAQIQLGRFDDALSTFREADHFNTPQVSRWTWMLGAGWTYMLMGRAEEAVSWLQRSIAITPGTGRTHLLLMAAYQQLGRSDEAKAALAKALELRPGSTARNALLPTKNTSPVYLGALERLIRIEVEAGLPEG